MKKPYFSGEKKKCEKNPIFQGGEKKKIFGHFFVLKKKHVNQKFPLLKY